MVNIGAGFVFSILTFYSLYQYLLRQNEFYGQKLYFHISYQIFYSIYACMVFYTGGLIAADVSISIPKLAKKMFSSHNFFHKGKKLARLVHSVINSCTDTEVTFSVNLYFSLILTIIKLAVKCFFI